jgi:hypothetical protein
MHFIFEIGFKNLRHISKRSFLKTSKMYKTCLSWKKAEYAKQFKIVKFLSQNFFFQSCNFILA